MTTPCWDPAISSGRTRWRLSLKGEHIDAAGNTDGERALRFLHQHDPRFRGWRLSLVTDVDPGLPLGAYRGKPLDNSDHWTSAGFRLPREPTMRERFARKYSTLGHTCSADHPSTPCIGCLYDEADALLKAQDSRIRELSIDLSQAKQDATNLQETVTFLETSLSEMESCLTDLPYVSSHLDHSSLPFDVALTLTRILERINNYGVSNA